MKVCLWKKALIVLLALLPIAVAGGTAGPGEVTLEYTQTEASGGAARITLVMFTPVRDIWAVLVSCARSFEYVDGMRACDVLEGGLEQQQVRQRVKKHWLLPELDYEIEFQRDPWTRIGFRRVAGDLRLLEGNWSFEPLDEGRATRVTHEIRVQPTFPVPRWLVRRTLAGDLPDMLLCLRAISGGSGSPEQAARDRTHCPKPARDH